MDQEKRRIGLSLRWPSIVWICLTLSLLTVNCAPQPTLERGTSLTLTTFTENSVEVVVKLQRAATGEVTLTATYTPLLSGFHLYSKDLPRNGINGLGRPTLLELSPDSKLQFTGPVTESVPSTVSSADPSGTLIYPDGPVTLTVPIQLPAGSHLVEDKISLTYMACSAGGCKAPVIGKIIPVNIPPTH